MKLQLVIALAFLMIGAMAPWHPLFAAIAENKDLDPEYILAAISATTLVFAVAYLARRSCKRVVLDGRARRARETNLPLAALNPLALAAHAALDQGKRAEGALRDALNSVAAGGLSPEVADRLIAGTDRVTEDLATVRSELYDVSRERRWAWL